MPTLSKWSPPKEHYIADAVPARRRPGNRAQLFSTHAVADDIDSVRAALGGRQDQPVRQLLCGQRRCHVCSATPSPLPFGRHDLGGTHSWRGHVLGIGPACLVPGITRTLCARSASCAAAVSSPTSELSWLAAALRRHPLRGTFIDGEGTGHSVNLTEAKLLNWLLPNPGYEWAGPGEVAQAARAFRGGDQNAPAPPRGPERPLRARPPQASILRFSRRGTEQRPGAASTSPSRGTSRPAWRQRTAQYSEGAQRAAELYGPFAKDAWLRPATAGVVQNLMQPDPCIASIWSDVPAFPGGSTVPQVQTLVMSGEYDSVVPTADARRVTDVLTESTFVKIPAAFHNVWGWSGCPGRARRAVVPGRLHAA